MGETQEERKTAGDPEARVRTLVREAIQEFLQMEKARAEPAYKAELVEERRRREGLESRMNELVEENRRSRQLAEELDRSAAIRRELQRLGVAKVDLAFKAVKEDIRRTEDGRLVAMTDSGEVSAKDYLHQFVNENPELLPARVAGGSGASGPKGATTLGAGVDLDKIRPGMSLEDLNRVREEVARVAQQAMRGQL